MICNKCKEDKSEDNFYKLKNGTIQKPCKKCRSKKNLEKFNNKTDEEKKEIRRKSYLNSKTSKQPYTKFHPWASKAMSGIRKRVLIDSRFNKGSEINANYLRNLYNSQNGLCYYTGIKMDLDSKMYKPSPDRIDSSIGYIDGNIVLCCTAVNYMKNSSSEEDTFNFIEAIRNSKNFSKNFKKQRVYGICRH